MEKRLNMSPLDCPAMEWFKLQYKYMLGRFVLSRTRPPVAAPVFSWYIKILNLVFYAQSGGSAGPVSEIGNDRHLLGAIS